MRKRNVIGDIAHVKSAQKSNLSPHSFSSVHIYVHHEHHGMWFDSCMHACIHDLMNVPLVLLLCCCTFAYASTRIHTRCDSLVSSLDSILIHSLSLSLSIINNINEMTMSSQLSRALRRLAPRRVPTERRSFGSDAHGHEKLDPYPKTPEERRFVTHTHTYILPFIYHRTFYTVADF